MVHVSSIDLHSLDSNPSNLIQAERKSSKLNIDEINVFLESTPEGAKLTDEIIDQIIHDPVIRTGIDYYESTKNEHRENTARKIARMSLYLENDIKIARKQFRKDVVKILQMSDSPIMTHRDTVVFDKRLSLTGNIDPQLGTRIGVHLGLFANCIRGNGTDSQIKYWLQERGAIFLKGIYGCFAMTELGHGSNVSKLKTIAVYSSETDTFLINTPNLTATKWWIGGAAHSATHSVVYARLLVDNKDYGVKTFIVPLRDPETFQLLPGVFIGDIGAKMGRDGIDNGWIQFKSVRIPREFMLSRFTKVIPGSPPKVISEPALEQLSGYSALLNGRVNMVMDSFRFGSKFVTIATRYAVGRQQFGPSLESEEVQLINYPLHQYRLLPQIALVYVMSPMAHKLADKYYNTLEELYRVGNDKEMLLTVSNKLKDLFIDSASLKATTTWLCAQLIDELRQTCGGHGYSSYNAFGKGYDDWVVQCTWEGDNTVLSLTSAKSILKKFIDLSAGKKITTNNSLDYLNSKFIMSVLNGSEDKVSSLKSSSDYTEIWAVIIIKLIYHCTEIISKTNEYGSISKLLILVSKCHSFHIMLKNYSDKLENIQESYISDDYTRCVMWKIYKLFSLYYIDKHSGEFLQFKIFSPEQITDAVQTELMELLSEIRNDCIGLTDAFKLPDGVINAPIGYYDGNIYHNYFNEVVRNNPTEKDGAGKPPYHQMLTTMLGRGYEFDDRIPCNSSMFEKLSK